ncbi:MAG TPA: Asp-tRNA(Asn)/Glu-tRNA(Gln) amidotransferase subunit GatA [Erysipelotrichaceae bacterium]|nr:Asp-tRNA(Asn)/Glu-tRNA(Gln) amidotransferase subunit GatA [Erysipelotrichaceae bacterium]
MDITKLKEMKSVQERVDEAVNKSHAYQADLNAMVSFIDPSEQIENLKHIDPQAPFYGVPVVLKDLVNMKGTVTTGSSGILENYVSPYDATITEKLRAAGAIIIGKSSCDTFGMGGTNMTAWTGPVMNPYDLTRMSGGSSGGSAVLVASGVVPMAIGTDTGDSIRKPASYNNIVGLKPTYGRISRYGVIPYASSLDHVGVFTRNVKDAALSLEVLAGRDDKDMTSSQLPVEAYAKLLNSDLEGKRIGIIQNVIDAIQNRETLNLFKDLCDQLTAKGALVQSIHLDEKLMHAFLPTYYIIANAEATANHANLDGLRFGVLHEGNSMEESMIRSRTAGFGKLLKKRFVIGSYALFTENQEEVFRKAQKVRRLIVEDLKRVLCEVDVVIAPASAQGAPKFDDVSIDQLSSEYLIAENYMALANFSGYPSITVPMGYVDGLPVGVNLTSAAFTEQLLLNVALAVEESTGIKDMIKEPKR